MAVFISDPDAFERLTRVEGTAWAAHTRRMWDLYRSAESFFAFRFAWTEGRAALDAAWKLGTDLKLTTIYGEAGYARYAVLDATGEIVLLASSTRPERCACAAAEGFTVRA